MTHFSKEFREFLIPLIEFDMKILEVSLSNLHKSEELTLAKNLIALFKYWYRGGNSPEHLLEKSHDQFTNANSCFRLLSEIMEYSYYTGVNEPPVDPDIADMLWTRIENASIGEDCTWDRNFLLSIKNTYAALRALRSKDFDMAIELQKKVIYYSRQLPEFSDLEGSGDNNLGVYYRMAGKFNKARDEHQKFWKYTKAKLKQGKEITLAPLYNYLNILQIQADFTAIYQTVSETIEIAEANELTHLLQTSLYWRSIYYSSQGEYQKAEDDLLRCHELASDNHTILSSQLQIIDHYEERFQITKNQSYLDKAYKWLRALESHEVVEMRQWWKDLVKFRRAKLQSHGNIMDKARAIEILESLVEQNPQKLDFLTHYLDLLLQDMMISESDQTKQKIDETIEKINSIPLHVNPQAIIEYSTQQLIYARYLFFIEGRVNQTLDILDNLEERLEGYELPFLQAKVREDRTKYEAELTKWKDSNHSIRDRITSSKMSNYLKDAMRLVNMEN